MKKCKKRASEDNQGRIHCNWISGLGTTCTLDTGTGLWDSSYRKEGGGGGPTVEGRWSHGRGRWSHGRGEVVPR